MKVIVGFDGSAPAIDALHLGADLCEELHADLVVVAVFESLPGELRGATPEEDRDRYFSDTLAKAEGFFPEMEFERRMIDDGSPRASLIELAEEIEADLLVIGSTHLGAVARAVTGTAGGPLFNDAPCGVVVAPKGWSRRKGHQFAQIGVGYDGTGEAQVALQHASHLAKDLGADLRLIAVAPYVDPRLSAVVEEPSEWLLKLRDGVKLVEGGLEARPVLRQGRPATELAQQGVDLDLLVVGSRRRGQIRRTVLGSVSSELVRTSPCPVLVVPRGAEVHDDQAHRASSGSA